MDPFMLSQSVLARHLQTDRDRLPIQISFQQLNLEKDKKTIHLNIRNDSLLESALCHLLLLRFWHKNCSLCHFSLILFKCFSIYVGWMFHDVP